jgi:uncharacterized protein (UPF0333 family)
MNTKAQASTEYLVILAVVVVVALVVVSLMGEYLGLSGETSDTKSKTYWARAQVGILDWLMDSDGDDTIVIKNNQQYDIYVRNVTIGDTMRGVNATLTTGAQKTIKTDWVDCDSGSPYSYAVTFVYDNAEFNLTGKRFTGTENLVGNCQ